MSLKHRVRFKGWKRLKAGLSKLSKDKRRLEKLAADLAKIAEEERRGSEGG